LTDVRGLIGMVVNTLLGDVEITNIDDLLIEGTPKGMAKVDRACKDAGLSPVMAQAMSDEEFDMALEAYMPEDPCPICNGKWDWIDTNAHTEHDMLSRGLLISFLNGDIDIPNILEADFTTTAQGDAKMRAACIEAGFDPDGFHHLMSLNMAKPTDRQMVISKLTVDKCPICNNTDAPDRWYRSVKHAKRNGDG